MVSIYIDEDDETRERTVRVDYNEPLDNLLSRLVPAWVHHDLEANTAAHREEPVGGSSGPTPRIAEVEGSHTSTLVEYGGVEPPTSAMRMLRSSQLS